MQLSAIMFTTRIASDEPPMSFDEEASLKTLNDSLGLPASQSQVVKLLNFKERKNSMTMRH